MEKQVQISGVIITFNEEKNIARCIESLQTVCDEIVVIDSFSTDRTQEICNSFGVKFIEHQFDGHIEQKNYALTQCKHDLVLSLDADEALSKELQENIKQVKKDFKNKAYKFNRFTNYCGKWIKHCGWYPDTKVRLWDKRVGKWGGTNPHDSVILDNVKANRLDGDILHYSYYSISEHIDRSNRYAKIAAQAMMQNGIKATYTKIIINPLFRFLKDFFAKRGFLDGFEGVIICATNSYTTFLKYIYLKALQKGVSI